jgi:glycosyltransferase involved in cell wall biosynthesis
MRIIVFVEYLPPRLGSDRRIFEIMKRLSRRHAIHFIVFPPFRALLEKIKNREVPSLNSPKEAPCVNHEGINGHFVPISPKIATMWQHSLIIAYSLTLMSVFVKSLKILKKINPDVVVLNYPSPYTGLLGLLEGKLMKKPVVLDFNDLIAQYTINILNLKKTSFKARVLLFVQQYIAKRVQIVIAPTFFIKKYITSLRVHERKTAIIPNGVDTRDFNPHRYNISQIKTNLGLDKGKLCLYSGRLEGWAGVNIISKLCDVAMNKKLDVKFVLVGSGTLKAIPKENAVLMGEVAYDKVPAILAIADAILIPFPNNEVAHAASPLKLFEGMSMQKPVIASKVSGIQDVVLDGENGFLADPENVNEWIEKLETILTYENIAKKVGQNARRTVEEKFEWNCLAKQYEEILNSVSRIQVIKSHVD